MGTGFGTNTHDIKCPSFAPNNIYTLDNTVPELKMYDNTLFAEIKSTALDDPFANMAEIPGMNLFIFKNGDTSLRDFNFIDQDLNILTPAGYSYPTMSNEQIVPVAVDPNYPYMIIADITRSSG